MVQSRRIVLFAALALGAAPPVNASADVQKPTVAKAGHSRTSSFYDCRCGSYSANWRRAAHRPLF